MAKKTGRKVPVKVKPAQLKNSTPRASEAEAIPPTASAAEAVDRADSPDLRECAYQLAGRAVMADRLGVPLVLVRVGLDPEGERVRR